MKTFRCFGKWDRPINCGLHVDGGKKLQNEAAIIPCDYRACCVCFGNHILHIFGNRTCSFDGIAGRKVAQEKRLWLALGKVVSAGFGHGRNRQHVCHGAGSAPDMAATTFSLGMFFLIFSCFFLVFMCDTC